MTINLQKLLIETLNINPNSFKDQVVVITGAGQGIGLHTARAFAHLGATVIIAELTEKGKEAEDIIRSEGGKAIFYQTDVSDSRSVDRLSNFVMDEYSSISILINNAIFIEETPVIEMTTEIWDRTMEVNLRGTFLTCRAFLPQMNRQNQGIIINMISTEAMPGLSAYIASKQGILGFTQSLSQEVQGSRVKVIPFGPGMVDTPGIHKVAPGLAPLLGIPEDAFLKLSLHQAYEGLMPPEHAAAAAVYLALYLSEEFHGQEVNGYDILEKAGLIKVELPRLNERAFDGKQKEIKQNQEQLLKRISLMLEETETEFGKLPVFARPLAKQGFKKKAGMSLSDWKELITNLEFSPTSLPSDIYGSLGDLANYYREVPKEMARFTKDEETLQEIMRISEERVSIITSFQKTVT